MYMGQINIIIKKNITDMESCQCHLLLCHIVATTEPVETTLAATTPFGEYIQNQRLICSSMYNHHGNMNVHGADPIHHLIDKKKYSDPKI